MAYDEKLADRTREIISRTHKKVEEKKMFGGVGFLLNGNLLVGVWKQSLIVRLGPQQAKEARQQEFVREFDITGRPMKGWVLVEPDGLEFDDRLKDWLDRAEEFVETLPAK